MNEQPLSEAALQSVIDQLPAAERYLVAYSGGMDSSVLLLLLARLARAGNKKLSALHVNHGLNPDAGKWASHCRSVCEEMKVGLAVLDVDATADGESPEEAARNARYAALSGRIGSGDILFTAHHRDDQAETLLLQLFRGAGPDGLAAMPFVKPLGQGMLARPLLGFAREAIREVALQEDLHWIDDDSNSDQRFDRNFIRTEVMPVLQQRWPAITAILYRAATHQADASHNLRALAAADWESMENLPKDQLDSKSLEGMSRARAGNLIRYWLLNNGFRPPGRVILHRILTELIAARDDANPCVRWQGAEVRRYQQRIYVMRPLSVHDSRSWYRWNMDQPLQLSCGVLSAIPAKGKGIARHLLEDRVLDVRFRQGGEVLHPAGRSHNHEVKKLFQEAAVPPWLRDRIPFLYYRESLVAIAGYWIDASVYAKPDEPGYDISFKPIA